VSRNYGLGHMADDLDKPLTRREWDRLEEEKHRKQRKAGLAVLGLVAVVVALGAAAMFVLQILACGFLPTGCR
jgi:hypothetical protein